MAGIDLADDARLRSFYLEQAPPEVLTAMNWLYRQAELSPSLTDKRRTDDLLTYVAELIRVAQELRVVVEMAGLANDEAAELAGRDGDTTHA